MNDNESERVLEQSKEAIEAVLVGRIAIWVLSASARMIAAYAVILGVLLILSDPDRWNVSVYHVALLVPGAPAIWGVFLLLGGLSILFGIWKDMNFWVSWGLGLVSCWCFFFAISFGYALFVDNRASMTGVFAYVLIGTLSGIMSAASGRLHIAI